MNKTTASHFFTYYDDVEILRGKLKGLIGLIVYASEESDQIEVSVDIGDGRGYYFRGFASDVKKVWNVVSEGIDT